MNREQRRKVERDAKAKGISKQLTKLYLDMNKNGFEKPVEPNEIHDGDKVKINIDQVKTRRNYELMSEKYKEFVEASSGRAFTAKVERENLISMEEEPAWLFWSGDLTVVNRSENGEE